MSSSQERFKLLIGDIKILGGIEDEVNDNEFCENFVASFVVVVNDKLADGVSGVLRDE